jgi:hypothetical protein
MPLEINPGAVLATAVKYRWGNTVAPAIAVSKVVW